MSRFPNVPVSAMSWRSEGRVFQAAGAWATLTSSSPTAVQFADFLCERSHWNTRVQNWSSVQFSSVQFVRCEPSFTFLLARRYAYDAGWAKKVGPQTRDHNSVKS